MGIGGLNPAELGKIMPSNEFHRTLLINIGPVNGSVSSGNKPLPESVLVQILDVMWHY